MPPSVGRRLPTLDTVRLVLAPALVFIVTGLDRGYQTELWQHLARGRLIAREATVVSTDRFTFTVPGRELQDNNWLSQLFYHGLYSLGGLDLVQVTNSLTLAAAVGLLVHQCRKASAPTRVAAVVGVCVFLGIWQTLLIRPQSFSMLLFVSLYGLVTMADTKPSLLWLAPPLMALWVNVHGGFGVGLLLLAAFAAPAAWQSRDWRWIACPFVAVLATLLNPYGWRVYQYAGSLSALGVSRGIEEWLPPSPRTLVGCAFAVSVLSMSALAVVCRRRVTLREACILGCFILPACMSVRMTVWWFLAAAPIAARWVGDLAARGPRTASPPAPVEARPTRAAAWALAGMFAVCLGSLPWLENYSPLIGLTRSAHRTESDLDMLAQSLPSVAVAASPPTKVFARMEWANYLAWRLEGRATVFIEGHVELYPTQTWEQYITVNDARPGWQGVLKRYDVRFLLLDQTYHAALLSEVRRSGQWSQRNTAGPALLFERRADAAHAAGDFSPAD